VAVSDALMVVGSGLAGGAVALASGRILPAWDALARWRIRSLNEMVEALGISEARLARALLAWGIMMVVLPVVFGPMLGMYVLVLPLMLLGYQSPLWLLSWVIASRMRLIRDQMVPFCFAMANTARSNLSLPQGLEEVLRDSPWPIRDVIQRITKNYHLGWPIIDAIRDTQMRLKLDVFNIFASVILTCSETGADYIKALESISHSLQENQRLERKLAAETAAGRTVITVLGGFPFVFLGMFYFIEPVSTGLVFSTVPGQCVLVAVGFLTYLSVSVARKILAIEI